MRVSTRDIYTRIMCSENEVIIPLLSSMVETFLKGPVLIREGAWKMERGSGYPEIIYRTYANITPTSWPFCPEIYRNIDYRTAERMNPFQIKKELMRFTLTYVEEVREVLAFQEIRGIMAGLGIPEGFPYTVPNNHMFDNENTYHLVKRFRHGPFSELTFIRAKVDRIEERCIATPEVRSAMTYHCASLDDTRFRPADATTFGGGGF